MRFYTFSNMYLSSMQVALQSGHVLGELYTKYLPTDLIEGKQYHYEFNEKAVALTTWAKNHKTMIFLNAGYSSEIHFLTQFFSHVENPYPWAEFYESESALDGALTCIGIILPEKIYKTAEHIRKFPTEKISEAIQISGTYYSEDGTLHFNKWEFELLSRLNNYVLAK